MEATTATTRRRNMLKGLTDDERRVFIGGEMIEAGFEAFLATVLTNDDATKRETYGGAFELMEARAQALKTLLPETMQMWWSPGLHSPKTPEKSKTGRAFDAAAKEFDAAMERGLS
jgi:hypothetical protein